MAKQKTQEEQEEHTFSFNLVTEPWIKVLKDDGTNEMLSLKDVFEQADSIIELSNENIYVDASITLILFAIIYTAYSSQEELKQSGKFEYNAEVIVDYLKKNEDLFDLYDKKRPFLQVTPEMELTYFVYNYKKECTDESKRLVPVKYHVTDNKTEIKISLLDAFNSSNNKSCLWDVTGDTNITDDWIARQLVTFKYWHVRANNKKPINPITQKCVKFVSGVLNSYCNLLFVKGNNLAELFTLNVNSSLMTQTMRPLWEIPFEASAEMCWNDSEEKLLKKSPKKTSKESTKNKSNKSDEKDPDIFVYVDPSKDNMDIAQILTLSNIHVRVIRNKNILESTYQYAPSLPIKKCSNDTYINHFDEVFTHSYSIASHVLESNKYPNAKRIDLVRSPNIRKEGTCYENTYEKPVVLIGNALLHDESNKINTQIKRRGFLGMCKQLEKYESVCRSDCSYISKKFVLSSMGKSEKELSKAEKDRFDAICNGLSNKYEAMIEDACVFAEEMLENLCAVYLSMESDRDLRERLSTIACEKVKAVFDKTYKQFISENMPKAYFIF